MELELGLAPFRSHFVGSRCFYFNDDKIEFGKSEVMKMKNKKKRSCDGAFDGDGKNGRKTLPLFKWSRQPDDEDDQNAQDKSTKCQADQGIISVDEKSKIIGWPPITSWRKKILHEEQQRGDWVFVANNSDENASDEHQSNSTFVKVKMEGEAIGRKINLTLYHSYHALAFDLINMFGRNQECRQNSESYTILYQDKRGEWLAAGDVPWMTFVGSVHKIRIMKN